MPSHDSKSEWDILRVLTSFVATTHGLGRSAAEKRAMYLFSISDIMLAPDVGRSMQLTEIQTATGLVWNQWNDLAGGSTRLQRLLDRTLRDHYRGVEKLLDRYGGHITTDQAREFRERLERAYLQRQIDRFRSAVNIDD